MASEDIKAGGAYIEITAQDSQLKKTLKSCDALIDKWCKDTKKSMKAAASDMGTSFALMSEGIRSGIEILKSGVEKLSASFSEAFEDMKANGTESQKAAAEEIQSAWDNLHKNWLSGLQEIIGIFSGSLAEGLNSTGGLLAGLTEKLHENKNVIAENATIAGAWIQGFIGGLPQCWDLVKNIGIGIANIGISIANLPAKMYEWVKSFEPIRKVMDYVGKIFGFEGLSEIKIPELEKLDYVDSTKDREQKSNREAAKVRAEDNIEAWKVDNGKLDRLDELSKGSNLKNSELDEAQKYVDELTKKYGDLGIQIDRATGSISGMEEAQKKVNDAQQEGRRQDLIAMGLPTLQVDNGNFKPGSTAVKASASASSSGTGESSALKRAQELVDDNNDSLLSAEEREKKKAQSKYDDTLNARIKELTPEYGDRAQGMAVAELAPLFESVEAEKARIDKKYRDEEAKADAEARKKKQEEDERIAKEEEDRQKELARQEEEALQEYKSKQIEQMNSYIDNLEQAQNDSRRTYSSAGTFNAYDQIDMTASYEKTIADATKQQLTEQKSMVNCLRQLVELYEESDEVDLSPSFA